MTTSERKLVWTAEEIGAAESCFHDPLDDGAEVFPAPLSRIAGLQRAGINFVRVPPGRRAFPLHRHDVEAEWAYVISGTADTRLGAGHHGPGAGGSAVFPAGGPAHAVEDPSAEAELICLTGGENAPAEIVGVPEALKRIVRGRDMFDVADAKGFAPFGHLSKSPLSERDA